MGAGTVVTLGLGVLLTQIGFVVLTTGGADLDAGRAFSGKVADFCAQGAVFRCRIWDVRGFAWIVSTKHVDTVLEEML